MSEVTIKKRKQRINLARRIETSPTQTEMTPCSRCESQGRTCLMDQQEGSRCSECVRSGVACDGLSDAWERNVPSDNDWARLLSRRADLRRQREAAVVKATEAIARVARLQKQEELAERQESEMARRGFKFLEELDAAEEREKREKEKADQEAATAAQRSLLLSDDSFSGIVLGPLDPTWESLGFGGETPQASQGT